MNEELVRVKKKFIVTLRDNLTHEEKGITHTCADSQDLSAKELADFMWEDGNYSCDCNRFSHFYPCSDENYPCGDERFTLVSIDEAVNE